MMATMPQSSTRCRSVGELMRNLEIKRVVETDATDSIASSV